jgi:hypothetical protein
MGDSTDEKPDGVTESSNVNGISAANDFVAASEIGLSSDTNHVDILCMAEDLEKRHKD